MTLPQLWSVVVPVKRPEFAKSRLAPAVGSLRPALARAFAADTVSAALTCHLVGAVVVVTDDDEVAKDAVTMGADAIEDTPDAGLNPALRHGAAYARELWPDLWVAAMSADLPALKPAELGAALEAASSADGVSFVADAAGVGTVLYAAGAGAAFGPRFGAQSRSSHLSDGAAELAIDDVPSLRRDVDTLADLRAAADLGLGPRTAPLVAELIGVC